MNYVLRNQLLRLRMFIVPSAEKRTRLIRKKNIFASMGKNVFFQPRKLPADPKLIKFHDNIQVASDVTFVTHDVIHRVFQNIEQDKKFDSHLGCIEIMDNVFIGSGSIIMSDVRIGPNAIVAAGSVVTKDVMPGSVVGGVPARVIGNFEEVKEKRAEESLLISVKDRDKRIPLEWNRFYEKRGKE